MYNLGCSGSETGLFRSVFVWGGAVMVWGCMPALSLRDTRVSTKLGQWC